MTFDAVDVEQEPEALKDLERLGIPLVPAVVVGDRVAHGWNPKGVAELVGVPYFETEHLLPAELTQRLEKILLAAQHAISQVPAEHIDMTSPGRDRSVRQLGYHIFRLCLAFRNGMEEGQYPERWLLEEAPPEITDGAAVAGYGQMVLEQLTDWLRQPGSWKQVVNTYYGPQTAHELLERTVWHAAQHLRQIYDFLNRMGLTPDNPLADADFTGLPLPKEVW